MARAVGARRAYVRTTPAAVGMLLRRLRVDLALAATVVGVVVLTSAVFSALPRLYNSLSDDGLRYSVAHANVFERNLVMTHGARIDPGPSDPFSGVDQAGAQFQQGLAPSIQRVIDHRDYVVDAPEYRFPEPAGTPPPLSRHVQLRYQSGIESHIAITEGRAPARTSETYTPTSGGSPMPVVEAAMSPATAENLNVKLGDYAVLESDPNERLSRNGGTPKAIALHIVGYLQVKDSDADYWFSDVRFDPPSVYDDGNQTQVYAEALFAPAAYGDILNDVSPSLMGYTYRYEVSPDRFDASQLSTLADDLHRLDAKYPPAFLSRPSDYAVSTQLTSILNRFFAGRRFTVAILSLTGLALLAMAAATIGLAAGFVAVQRRATTALLRGRGASARQLLLGQATEGVLLCLPAALLGLAIATLLVDARASVWSLVAAGATALVAVVLLVATAYPSARRPLGTIERDDVVVSRVSARRLVFEAFVVVLAVGGVYLLRRRGLAGDSGTAAVGGFDPYLAAVPLLLGLALGLIVRRLFVFPVRLLAWQASFRRDLVPFLGFRRLARQAAVTSVPLLVLLLSVAISVFSSVLLHSIDVGQRQSSWQVVGADYQVTTFLNVPLPRDLDLTTVPSVEAVAQGFRKDDVTSGGKSGFPGTVTFLAVDAKALASVNAGRPVDTALPQSFTAQPTTDIGSVNRPIPAVISHLWNGQQTLHAGDTFVLNVNNQDLTFAVSDVRDQFPGLPLDHPFVVAQYSMVQMALSALGPRGGTITPDFLYVRAPAAAVAPIRQLLKQQAPLSRLISRDEQYASVHDSPLIAGAARGFQLGLIMAAVYSALAVGLTLALTGKARSRDLAYLRTLGLSWRQSIWLIVAEQAPTTALALVIGIALGIGVLRLISPGLSLTTFIGPGAPGSLLVDRTAVTLIAISLVVTVALAVALVNLLLNRVNLGSVLRLGDQP